MERTASNLLGRDDELGQVVAAIKADRSMAIIGEAGIGKTSLVRVAASASGRRLHEGGGFATLRDSPLLALRRALDTPLAGDDATIASIVEHRVGPDLLFVDDLQWVDQSTYRVLGLLQARISLIVAIRSGDPATGAAVDLATELGIERLTLAGLEAEAARTIVGRVRPDLGPGDVERVVSRAGGNPLVLQEMAAHGETSLVLARSIQAGVDHLSPAGRDIVELLAIADQPLDRRMLGGAIDEPLQAGILVEQLDQVEIRHALVAEAIRERLDSTQQRGLHERVADLVAEPAEVARHLALAGLPSRAASTASAALATAEDPMTRAALLVVIADAADHRAGLAPRLAAGAALSTVSNWDAVVRLLEPDDVSGSPDELAERDALLAHAAFSLGHHAAARGHIERASSHALAPGSPTAAHVAIERAAFMVNVDGELLAGIDCLDRELADHPPDRPAYHAIRAILESMRMLAVMPVDIDYLRGAVDAAMAGHQYASAADLARVATFALHIWEGAEPALSFVDDIGGRLERAGVSSVASACRAESVQASVLAGRPAEAVARADELLELPAPIRVRQTATIFRAQALGLMGLLDEATRALAELEPSVTSDFVGRGWLMWIQADLALWGGLTDRAVELVEAVRKIPAPIFGAYGLPEITRAWAQFDAGIAPEPPTGILSAPAQAGASFEMEGLRLLHAGDPLAAATQFAAAASRWSAFHVTRELHCRWAEGEALRRAGDQERAIECLDSALEAATTRQIETVAVRIRRSLRQAGRRMRTVERNPRITSLGLTRRERELVELVGQGLTNVEIARRMGLGRPTVARILSNAMIKLGAGSRGQAVKLVTDRV